MQNYILVSILEHGRIILGTTVDVFISSILHVRQKQITRNLDSDLACLTLILELYALIVIYFIQKRFSPTLRLLAKRYCSLIFVLSLVWTSKRYCIEKNARCFMYRQFCQVMAYLLQSSAFASYYIGLTQSLMLLNQFSRQLTIVIQLHYLLFSMSTVDVWGYIMWQ